MNVSVQGQRGPGYALGYNAGQRIEGMLPSGSYVVDATSYGSSPASGKIAIRVADGPFDGPTMTLVPFSSISLNVKEEFNENKWNGSGTWQIGQHMFAIRGPRLYLQASVETADDFSPSRGGSLRPPTGPNDDSLVLENLAPGRYWLRLNTSRGYIAAATMGNLNLLHEPFTVGSGASAPVEIILRDDSGELEGKVSGIADKASTGSEAAEVHPILGWVYFVPLPDSTGQFQQTPISPDGTFMYANMAPGNYRILAFTTLHQDLPYRDPEAMKAYESKGQVIQIAAGQKATVQIQLISSAE